MRDHLATLVEDFRRYDREIAVVRYQGNRRRVSTYGQIAQWAGRFASLLANQEIGPGDRVILWGENSAEWMGAFHGCMLRGVIAVPLDAYGSVEFASRVIADVKPKLAVGDGLLMRQLPADGENWNFPRINFESWNDALPSQELGPVDDITRDTPLQILFTSGTTGDPKGIVHTHGNVLASIGPIEKGAQGYLRYEKYVHPLRFLHTLPLSHVFGQTMGLWIPPIFRAQVHYENRLVASRLIDIIKRERISVLAAVPRIFALLKTHLESTTAGLSQRIDDAHGIRAWKRWWRFRDVHRSFGLKFWALISGGGALPPAVEHFWNALGFVVVQGYGMTETTALITLNHPFHVARGTIGKPLPGREVKIGPDGEVLVRGPMISTATWSGGELRQREDEWLATGDLAETQTTGELRFLGRKSEVIVTGSGVNIHPEDLEAALEEQPGVAACAVVAVETPAGPEPCAVLAMRGPVAQAVPAIENANTKLADFQRIRRWKLWPEPDLPRTSTGKVRRKAVAEWLASSKQTAGSHSLANHSSDWLLNLIAEITGESPQQTGDHLKLSEDLHLDSLGRVQLAAAIEQRLGTPPESGFLEQVQTLGELRALASGRTLDARRVPGRSAREVASGRREPDTSMQSGYAPTNRVAAQPGNLPPAGSSGREAPRPMEGSLLSEPFPSRYIYPHWPWSAPARWMRAAFTEGVMRPLVRLLAKPRIDAPVRLPALASAPEPMIIVCNHVTAYDGPLVQYALPGPVRRHIAAAMSGEMLEDFRHARNPERGPKYQHFYPLGPIAYFLLTALFNVFPLPRSRDFPRSFAHAGEALDRGFHVLVFPEGTRSAQGKLAGFRQGIGLLVKQSHAPVLPVAIRGLGELKAQGHGWFRSGTIEVRVGEPIRFGFDVSESMITERLHREVQRLLEGNGTSTAEG